LIGRRYVPNMPSRRHCNDEYTPPKVAAHRLVLKYWRLR
jgi:hypothetical protein